MERKIPYNDLLSNEGVVEAVVKRKERPFKPTRISSPDELNQLMVTSWSEDPSQRPTFKVGTLDFI